MSITGKTAKDRKKRTFVSLIVKMTGFPKEKITSRGEIIPVREIFPHSAGSIIGKVLGSPSKKGVIVDVMLLEKSFQH